MKRLIFLALVIAVYMLMTMGCSDPIEFPVGPDTDTVTVIEYDTTIVVEVDTMIINHYDTTIVVKIDTVIEHHYDTTYIERVDTLYIDRVDTVYVESPPDTIYVELPPDTVYVQLPPDTVIVELPPDTVIIQLPPDTVYIELPPDTVIQIITEYDTTYIPITNVLYYECNPWRLKWEKRSDTVNLNNPYVEKGLLGFDRIVLGTKPSGQEPVIRLNGQELFFPVYGEKSRMIWVGPMEVPANAKIVIEFVDPYYAKVAGTLCHDFLKGSHWFIVNADSINYQP